MDYEELRRFERLERGSSKLVELDKDFYSSSSELVRSFIAKAKESSEDARTLENVVKMLKSIFEYREQKVLSKALRCSRNGEQDLAGLTLEEQKLAQGLIRVLKEGREEFEATLLGKKRPAASIEDIPKVGELEDSFVLIRLVKKIPRFVSSDLKEYGPFEANEIARLPKLEAELLFNKSLAEKV